MNSSLLRMISTILKVKIIPTWRLERFPQTEYLRRILSNLEIDCVFDVGANVGQYHDYLRDQVGFKGLILSFEPNPECVTKIGSRISKDPLWKCYQYALGNIESNSSFNVTADSQFSSFLQPDNSSVPEFKKMNSVSETISVPVKTLEAIFTQLKNEFRIENPFLKLDTQGYDLNVLSGAGASLASFKGIQTEVSNIRIYENISSMEDTLLFLKNLDYDLGNIFPTNPDHFPLSIDFDSYFVKRNII